MVDGEYPKAAVSAATEAAGTSEAADHSGGATRAAPPLSAKDELSMRILRAAVYAEDRQAFSAAMDRLSALLSVIGGTALIAAIQINSPLFGLSFGFVISLLGALNLVFDFSNLARSYAESRRELMILFNLINDGGELKEIERKFMATYGTSSITFHAVNAMAYNAVQIQYDRPQNTLIPITFFQRKLRHICRYSMADFWAQD